MAKPLRIGIIGAGLMGRWHAYYAARAGAELVAIADPNIASAAALAGKRSAARTYATASELFEQASLHAVHICSPADTHPRYARQAVAAGVHALVEKPFAPDFAETRAILDQASLADVSVIPVHQFAFQDGVAHAMRVLPRLGAVREVEFAICTAGGERLGGEGAGALLADIIPHPLSLLCAIWPGTPLDLSGWAVETSGPGELVAIGRHADFTANVTISLASRPTVCEARIRCGKGTIELNFFHGYALLRPGKVSRLQKIGGPFSHGARILTAASSNLARRVVKRESAYPGLGHLIGRFYDGIQGKNAPPVSSRDIAAIALGRDQLMAKHAARCGND